MFGFHLDVNDGFHLNVEFKDTDWGGRAKDAISGLMEMLYHPLVTIQHPKIVVTLSPRAAWTKEDSVWWLKTFHIAETLRFCEWGSPCDRVLDALSEPVSEIGEWLCPKLTRMELEFSAEWTAGLVLKLVQTRGVVIPGLATKLDSLSVDTESRRAMNRKTFSAIREIMGEGATWPDFDKSSENDAEDSSSDEEAREGGEDPVIVECPGPSEESEGTERPNARRGYEPNGDNNLPKPHDQDNQPVPDYPLPGSS